MPLSPASSFGLRLAGRGEMMARPVAIAPDPGGVQVIGDASGAAEAFGVVAGMRLGEALGAVPAPAAGACRSAARRGGMGGARLRRSRGSAQRSSRGARRRLSSPGRVARAMGAPEGARAGAASDGPGRAPAGPGPPGRAGGGASLRGHGGPVMVSERQARRRSGGVVAPRPDGRRVDGRQFGGHAGAAGRKDTRRGSASLPRDR